jgi:1-deoxy-D-xylulose-5-phosphate reductoisomerase
MKNIAILGSTGSIGTQAIEVVQAHPDSFSVSVLSANSNVELLAEQARLLHPKLVVIGDEEKYAQLKERLSGTGISCSAGEQALIDAAAFPETNMVLTALVGYSGLRPTLSAIEAGKDIALANKETLVVAGELVTEKARQHGVNIYPVDSEHSAIFQCLTGEENNPIECIYLTASGGPFRGKKWDELKEVTREQALKHPNWNMGAKITIDSASLMNKGLEVIEAKWLFNLKSEQIKVIVHPQSIIHSVVQFEDGSMKAQMGLPDMKLPIQYALGYPKRISSDFRRFNFMDYPQLTFEQPDLKTFRNLELAYKAMDKGGNMPCVLNAANEIMVDAFLNNRIRFTNMPEKIEQCMNETVFIAHPSLSDYIETDYQTRLKATALIN